MSEFRVWRDAPKAGETYAAWMAAEYVDGHWTGKTTSGHACRANALHAIGAPRKGSYSVEALCREAGAIGKFNFRWFHNVALVEMSTEAAIIALHQDFDLEINRVRTVTSNNP